MSSTATARRFLTARPSSGALLDAALAAVVLALTLALLSHGSIDTARTESGVDRYLDRDLDLIGVALAAGSAVPLVVWRRFPLGVFAVSGVASVFLAGLRYPLDLTLGTAAALYLLAASRGQDAPWTRRHTATVAALFVVYLGATAAAHGTFPTVELLHTGLAWAVAWFAGDRTRLRRERTERDAESVRMLAAAEERARIARDLHDSAGHAISVIAVRAGAARLRHSQDPERSLRALEAIEELARQTGDEIDQIVGTLREGGPANEEVEAPAGLASLDTLIAHHAAAGLAVTIDESGARRILDGAADQAVYRILQEALTNASRHGAGSARIELEFGDEAIELTVTNTVPAKIVSRPSGGHGLIGMRERATLLGGSLRATRSDGEFRVRARIPFGGHRS